MSASGPKRAGRHKTSLPPCYYEGFLEKSSSNEKTARRFWTSLCGNTLFFFNNTKDNNYVEKLELSCFVSLLDDCSRDRKLDAARFLLKLKDGEHKITAPSLEARELWKGFIYSIVELSVPCSLNLLPGQLRMMAEVVEKEQERRSALSQKAIPTSDLYVIPLADMPPCYQEVSRIEAEMILERNPKCGNLLLRKSTDGFALAATTREELNGPVFRHYRVIRRHDGGFSIAIQTPIHCPTLNDVVNCLVEKTAGNLKPFIQDDFYEENITFVQSNEENGEKTYVTASSPCPIPPPKPAFLQFGNDWEKRQLRQASSPSYPTPAPRSKPASNDTVQTSDPDSDSDSIYLNDTRPEMTSVQPPPAPPLPPRLASPSPTPTDAPEGRLPRLALVPPTQTSSMLNELKLKLEQRKTQN